MKVVMAGQGAFGQRHLEGLKNIPDVEVVSLAGGRPETTKQVAEKFGIPHWTTDLAESLKIPGVEISGAECVGKTFPDFFERWAALFDE